MPVVVLILLAALGVPLWLVLGGLAAGLWSRRSFRRAPGVIAVRCRRIDVSGADPRWPRRTSYARWVRDVLIVHQGVALVRNRALPVADLSWSGLGAPGFDAFGEQPVAVRLRLDGGEVVEVVARATDRNALLGPFGDRPAAVRHPGPSTMGPPESPVAGW